MSGLVRIPVRAESPYDVIVGSGAVGELAQCLEDGGVRPAKAAVIHPVSLPSAARTVASALGDADVKPVLMPVPDGENAKTPQVAADCWARLGGAGLTRSDIVVGVGGGATTDVAGFAAATFLRGVRLLLVPTTLLGMVDAAIGGKTGINTAQGKNLVGAFHEPLAVLCDLDLLATLPARELRSGLAEVIKCGLIADAAILDLVRSDPKGAADPGSIVLGELVQRSVAVKADVVSGDLRETSAGTGGAVGREALNYGHTLGHAVERLGDFTLCHGEAVAVGMVYAAELASRLGLIDDALRAEHRALLTSVGLPVTWDGGGWQDVLALMRRDKKARGDIVRFVLLDGVGRPVIVPDPPMEALRGAYAAFSRRPDE